MNDKCETCGSDIEHFDHRGTRGMIGEVGCKTCHYAKKALRINGVEADDVATWVTAIALKAAAKAATQEGT